jgi:4-amino-4-deoxy-L-arabinose transferase-like glycosyltransferase
MENAGKAGGKEGIIRRLMKDEIFVIVLIILAAFVARSAFLPIKYGVRSDTAEFIVAGQNFVTGNGYTSISGYPDTAFPPLYPVMIGILWLFIGDGILAGRLISMIFGSLMVVPVYLIARKLYSKRVGYMAAVLVAFYFFLIYGSVAALTEIPYATLSITGIFIGLKAFEEKRFLYYLLSGVFLGLAYLTRLEGFGFIVTLALLTAIFWLLGKNTVKNSKRFLISMASLAVGFLIVAAPYITFLYQETGQLQIGNKDAFFILGIEQNYVSRYEAGSSLNRGAETFLDPYQGKIGNDVDVVDYVISNPGKLVYSYFTNVWLIVAQRLPHKFPIWFFAIAGLGLFGAAWNRKRFKREIYMISVILYPIISYGFFVTSARSAALTVALLVIWLAKGTDVLNGWFGKTLSSINIGKLDFLKRKVMGSESLKKLPFIIVFISLLPFMVLPLSWEKGTADDPYLIAGDWLKNNTPEGSKLMVREPEVAFYSERTYVVLPFANSSDIIEYGKDKGADYLIIDPNIGSRIPMLEPLLNETNAPPELELVHKFGTDEALLVYRFL